MTNQRGSVDDDARGKYEWPLAAQLDVLVSEYQMDREKYLKEGVGRGDPGLTWVFKNAEMLSTALLEVTGDLVSAEMVEGEHLQLLDDFWVRRQAEVQREREDTRRCHEMPEQMKQRLLRNARYGRFGNLEQDSPVRLVWEHLCAHLASESVDKAEDGATRLMDLWGLVIGAKPCSASVQFLRRVSRCYVWGFDTECIILCRSVLDTTFHELRPDLPDLAAKIMDVANAGRISRSVVRAATDVRQVGNKAIHYEPNIGADALEVIRKTLTVVEAIAGQPKTGQ